MRYLGVDITGKNRRSDWTLVDDERKSVLSGQGSFSTLLGVVDSVEPDIIAIDGPSVENQGLMKRPDVRLSVLADRATDRPKRGIESEADADHIYENCRVSEADLGRRGIRSYTTPQTERANLADWVRAALDLYDALADRYRLVRRPGAVKIGAGEKLIIEVYPHASFVVALGFIPQLKTSVGGCLERIACLVVWAEQLGVELGEMLELEQTLHKVDWRRIAETGAPEVRHDKLDALAAAFTAKSIALGTAWAIGHEEDGVIVLPKAPRERYSKRLGARIAR